MQELGQEIFTPTAMEAKLNKTLKSLILLCEIDDFKEEAMEAKSSKMLKSFVLLSKIDGLRKGAWYTKRKNIYI